MSITDKTYKKLTIQVSLNGLSFCVFDSLSNKPTALQNIPFNTFQNSAKIEDLFAEVFTKNRELTDKYDEILIVHSNNLSTFVPVALFDEEYLGSFLQYNTKVFETDFFTFDELPTYEMNNVYIPYVNMNNFFIDQFGSFSYKHSSTILVDKLLAFSKNIDERKMFVHVTESHFEIVVVQNQKLLLYNSYDYKTPEDFIYYILFTAEQLQLNPENFKLELLGRIEQDDEFYKIAYKYIRNISLFEQENTSAAFSVSQNREHFILLNT
jgi:hypothetical protein